MKTRINQLIMLLLIVLTVAACGGKKDEEKTDEGQSTKVELTIKGSDTVLPLSQAEAEEFMKKYPEAEITVVGGGSGVGVAALIDGTTDICMSSRDLKTDEELKFNEQSREIKTVTIAFDALSVIVHLENKVSQLTREQLEGIFTGEITNWKEIGGDDLLIVVYSRESSSGTYEFFKEHVMDKKNYGAKTLAQPATGGIIEAVKQTNGAIGYVGLAYETPNVKQIAVSYDQGATFMMPSVAAAKDKSYPISRPLFYLFDSKNESKVKPFVDYILSEEGQQIVSDVGYVPLN